MFNICQIHFIIKGDKFNVLRLCGLTIKLTIQTRIDLFSAYSTIKRYCVGFKSIDK